MKKVMIMVALIAVFTLIFAGTVFAAPVEKTEAFVCPVIRSPGIMNNPNAVPLGDTGTYTVGPPTGHHIMVPMHATNMDGAGIPGGPQSEPGDMDYTAIWAVQPE